VKRGGPDHPKIYRLAEILKCRRPTAIGYAELLFHFTKDYAPQGDIGKYSDKRIEAAMDWRGKSGRLIQAMIDCGRYGDERAKYQPTNTAGIIELHATYRLVTHDWHVHCDRVTRKWLKENGLCFLSYSENLCTPGLPPPTPTSPLPTLPDQKASRRVQPTCPPETSVKSEETSNGQVRLADWPQADTAIRKHFPACSDEILERIISATTKQYGQIDKPRFTPLSDEVLAFAVESSWYDNQRSPQAFEKSVPRAIQTWATQGPPASKLPAQTQRIVDNLEKMYGKK